MSDLDKRYETFRARAAALRAAAEETQDQARRKEALKLAAEWDSMAELLEAERRSGKIGG